MILIGQLGVNIAPILTGLGIFGLDKFGESSMVIRRRIKTLPLKQWTIARQYRIRLKKAFNENKIEIPFPAHKPVFRRGKQTI